jgi:ankyrin repeat protein
MRKYIRLLLLSGIFIAAAAHADVQLLDAARASDLSRAIARIAEGADVTGTDSTGATALHWAVYHDSPDLVMRLLESGADPSATSHYGSTPIFEAAIVGNVAVLRALIAAGADVNAAGADGQTPLMVVARTDNSDAAQLLIAAGADVNARETWKNQTALMWAASRGRPAMVRLLTMHGADVDARSLVHEWQRQTTVFPRAKYMPSGGLTPLLFAAREGCVGCVAELISAGAELNLPDPDEVSPLLIAVLNAHFDTARVLLEAGANPNKWDWWGRTPLYAAVDYHTIPTGGRPDRPSDDATTAFEMIELLLSAGANPNMQLKLYPPYRNVLDDRGTDLMLGIGATPLLRAARAGDVSAVELLLEYGALVDLPQEDEITPLMAASGLKSYAIDTRGRFVTEADALATVMLLLDAGADIDAKDEFGQTALHGAAYRGWNDLVVYLVERGADLSSADMDGHTPFDAAEGRIRGVGREANVTTNHVETARLIASLISGQSDTR